jgi:hypothetical protein
VGGYDTIVVARPEKSLELFEQFKIQVDYGRRRLTIPSVGSMSYT